MRLTLVFILSLNILSQTIILKPKSYLDVDTGKFIAADIEIKNGVITQIGRNLSNTNAEIISLKDKVLLPGLIDTHVHLIGNNQLIITY